MAVRHIGAGHKVKRDKYGRYAPKKGGIKPFKSNLNGVTRTGHPNKGPRRAASKKRGVNRKKLFLTGVALSAAALAPVLATQAPGAVRGINQARTADATRRNAEAAKFSAMRAEMMKKPAGFRTMMSSNLAGSRVQSPGSSATIHIMAGYRIAQKKRG